MDQHGRRVHEAVWEGGVTGSLARSTVCCAGSSSAHRQLNPLPHIRVIAVLMTQTRGASRARWEVACPTPCARVTTHGHLHGTLSAAQGLLAHDGSWIHYSTVLMVRARALRPPRSVRGAPSSRPVRGDYISSTRCSLNTDPETRVCADARGVTGEVSGPLGGFHATLDPLSGDIQRREAPRREAPHFLSSLTLQHVQCSQISRLTLRNAAPSAAELLAPFSAKNDVIIVCHSVGATRVLHCSGQRVWGTR
jgi:hypothetical protein